MVLPPLKVSEQLWKTLDWVSPFLDNSVLFAPYNKETSYNDF